MVRKRFAHFARVHHSPLLHEGQHLARTFGSGGVPLPAGRARVQQRQHLSRHEAVVDKGVLFHAQPLVAALQVAGAVVAHPLVEDEVLRARRRAHGIGLHEPEPADGGRQRQGFEQAARDRIAAQLGQGGRARHGRFTPPA
jgi:hypothetical protein